MWWAIRKHMCVILRHIYLHNWRPLNAAKYFMYVCCSVVFDEFILEWLVSYKGPPRAADIRHRAIFLSAMATKRINLSVLPSLLSKMTLLPTCRQWIAALTSDFSCIYVRQNDLEGKKCPTCRLHKPSGGSPNDHCVVREHSISTHSICNAKKWRLTSPLPISTLKQ